MKFRIPKIKLPAFRDPEARLVLLPPDKAVELAARDCYGSLDKVMPHSSKTIIRRLYKNGHMACLEFGMYYFKSKFQYDIGSKHAICCEDENGNIFYAISMRILAENPNSIFTPLTDVPELLNFASSHPVPDDLERVWDASDVPEPIRFYHMRFFTNRGIANELVRHRLSSFAQSSTRWIKYALEHLNASKALVFCSPNMDKEFWFYVHCWFTAFAYNRLRKKQHAAQFAREVLSAGFGTYLNMMTYKTHWDHVYNQRAASDAHPYVQSLIRETGHLIQRMEQNKLINTDRIITRIKDAI